MFAYCVISRNSPYIGGHLVINFKLFFNKFHCDAVEGRYTNIKIKNLKSICT